MKLILAKLESDWDVAKEILLQVIENLDKNGKSLWQKSQVEVIELKKHYKLEDLYFLCSDSEVYGMLFIQQQDLVFWPEIKTNESYFIHKLAVLPKYKGRSYGYKTIDLVQELAKLNNIKYLRLDCDHRPELVSFYENYGFSFVSKFACVDAILM